MDNQTLFFSIYNLSHQSQILDRVMVFITDYVLSLTILLTFILAIKGKIAEKKALLLIILGIPISILLIQGIHLFISEPRPFVTYHFLPLANNHAGSSFPSRHATIMAVIAFALTFLKSKWASLFLVLMIVVGFSRIYVGVHYPLDILGGFITGIISLVIAKQILKLIYLRFFR